MWVKERPLQKAGEKLASGRFLRAISSQWFSTRGDFVPRGHLTLLEAFLFVLVEEKVLLAFSEY